MAKFKEGDRVEAKSYYGVLVLENIDDFLTSVTGKIHWNTVSEDYLQGKRKINTGEIYSEDELTLL
jgi:hypothetical protein